MVYGGPAAWGLGASSNINPAPGYGAAGWSSSRPLPTKKLLELERLYSNKTQGKAMIDPYGRVLGYELEGTNIETRAQDRLFAQLTGATAQQLLGPGAPGARPNLAYLRPEQLESLLRLRDRFGSNSNGAEMAANLSAPGMGLPLSPADGSSLGVQRGFSATTLALAGAGILLVLLFSGGRRR